MPKSTLPVAEKAKTAVRQRKTQPPPAVIFNKIAGAFSMAAGVDSARVYKG